METLTMKKAVELVDTLAGASLKNPAMSEIDPRAEGSYTPLIEDPRREYLHKGFLSDYTGECRIRLFYSLLGAGFEKVKYSAPYFWTVERDGFEVQYVEGDVYLVEVAKRATVLEKKEKQGKQE